MNLQVTYPRPYNSYSTSGSYNNGLGQPTFGVTSDSNQDPFNYYNNYKSGYPSNFDNDVNDYCKSMSREIDLIINQMAHDFKLENPSNPTTQYTQRYEPTSFQNQERNVYGQGKRKEQLPYQKQAVSRPESKLDQLLGLYRDQELGSLSQSPERGTPVTYNIPIGLYSRENSLSNWTEPLNQRSRVASNPLDGFEGPTRLTNSQERPFLDLKQFEAPQMNTTRQESYISPVTAPNTPTSPLNSRDSFNKIINRVPRPYTPLYPEYTSDQSIHNQNNSLLNGAPKTYSPMSEYGSESMKQSMSQVPRPSSLPEYTTASYQQVPKPPPMPDFKTESLQYQQNNQIPKPPPLPTKESFQPYHKKQAPKTSSPVISGLTSDSNETSGGSPQKSAVFKVRSNSFSNYSFKAVSCQEH